MPPDQAQSTRSPRRLWLVGLVVLAVAAGAAWSLLPHRAKSASLRPGTPALINFHMDCPACKRTRAILTAIEAEHGARLQVLYVDVRDEANTAMMERHRVRIVPLLVLLDAQGGEVWRSEGPCDETKLRDQLGRVVR